jgi:serine/threonine protein kinase
VLLAADWHVKLCDFGLSRYQDKFCEENHGKIGTPHWMAPEILRGEEYREASDVYSFGVIVWELCTGEIPFYGWSVAQITGGVGYYRETLTVSA